MSATKIVSAAVLAGAMAAALSSVSTPAAAADEKCYGVALAGQNDCKAGAHACAGHSTVDYDPQSFKLVPAGTCTTMEGAPGKTGTLEPMES